jgi:hypothetical protein
LIKDIQFESGAIVTVAENGGRTRHPISGVLRALDIPTGLTHTQVVGITTLANLIVILIRTLIDRKILDESFLENDEMDLDHIIQVIEDMGGAYHDPNLHEGG